MDFESRFKILMAMNRIKEISNSIKIIGNGKYDEILNDKDDDLMDKINDFTVDQQLYYLTLKEGELKELKENYEEIREMEKNEFIKEYCTQNGQKSQYSSEVHSVASVSESTIYDSDQISSSSTLVNDELDKNLENDKITMEIFENTSTPDISPNLETTSANKSPIRQPIGPPTIDPNETIGFGTSWKRSHSNCSCRFSHTVGVEWLVTLFLFIF